MSIPTKSSTKIFLIVVFLVTGLFVENSLSVELYPNRPITMVSASAGGMGDTLTRLIAKIAEKELGQPIIIENKPGATGTVGMNYTLKSKPDGYTIGTNATSVYNIVPNIRKVPYNPFTDIIDITTFCKYSFGLAVRADAPWNTLEEIIQYAKNNPGKFTYSVSGIGRPQHIIMEWIAMKEGIKLTPIPFNDSGEAVVACLGGHANATVGGNVDILSQVKAGKLKVIVILDDKRWSTVPGVPSILEKGYNFYVASYMSVLTPMGVPDAIIKKLEGVFDKAKKDPSFTKALEEFEVAAGTLSGKEYSALWRSQYDEIGKVIKTLGLQEK